MKVFSLLILAVSSATALAQPQESAIGPRFPPVAAALDAPIEWKAVRGEDGKPLPPQISGDFKVELVAGAWARERQFDSVLFPNAYPQSNFDMTGFAGFAVQPRLTDRDGKTVEDTGIWHGQITLDDSPGSIGASWKGDKNGGIYLSGLTPYAKRGTLRLDFADPKRPPEAEGRFESRFRLDDLPYPTQPNTFMPVDKVFETAHGSKITLLGYGLYPTGLPDATNGKEMAPAGLYFFIKQVKPEGFKDAELNLRGIMVGDRGGNLDGGPAGDRLEFLTGRYSDLRDTEERSSRLGSENQTNIFEAPAAPRPLHFQIGYTESHPAWKQNQYFHSVSFPFDFRGYPMPTRDAKFAPLATAKNADLEVALDLWQDRSDELKKPNYLAWFWTRDLKIKDDPSLRWIVRGISPRPGQYRPSEIGAKLSDGATVYKNGEKSIWGQWSWRFRPDGAPVLGSEYRPAVTFSADALQGQPQKWDMSVEFTQWRLKKHEWNWKAVPIPPMGQKQTLNQTAISPLGARVKLVHVAVYDASHRFAGIERELVPGRDNAQGVAISFEAQAADFKGSKAFDWSEVRHNSKPSPGPEWGTSGAILGDQISGQKSDAKVVCWTQIYPLDKLEANSFDFQLSWEADYPTGRTATFLFPNLPAPTKDSR